MIDARLAGHSGIGTYLSELLPRVVPALEAFRPRVLASPAQCEMLRVRLGRAAAVEAWDVPPLTPRDLLAAPSGIGAGDLLWTPHFNVPLRGRHRQAVTLHDILPLTAPALAGRGHGWPVRAWLRAIRSRAQAVLCVSQFTRAEAMRVGRLAASRLTVTHLAADEAWFTPADPPPSRLPETRTIVYVGLLKPHKNVARLLRAFRGVRDRIPHRLLLVARHHGIRTIDHEALTLAQAMPDRVELVESLPFAELLSRVKRAEIAAQPSLHEGFGLPALEAMAAGVPVLAAHAGALPEVCGEAAQYCNPDSERDIARALVTLAEDASLRRRLVAEGRRRARMYSWDECARVTTDLLRTALVAPSR